MKNINTLTIDSSDCVTDLCLLGAEFGTDKSPYSAGSHHRHGYSAIYDLLFSSFRHQEIIFGEVGILDNASIKMWRQYFPRAKLFGFELFQERIDKAQAENIPSVRYFSTDISNKASLSKTFLETAKMFDILIDDSTHIFEHQILFVEAAIDFVKPGGLIIIEDIFRGWSEARYSEALAESMQFIDWSCFLDAKHRQGFSEGNVEPYYDNDKILVLRRNGVRKVDGERKKDDAEVPHESGLKVFMATHKPYLAPADPCYAAVQAGAALNCDFGLLRDDEGENISTKNPYYSEMTVHYWAWRNTIANYVGIVHYRRFFAADFESIDYRNKRIASGRDLAKDLETYDMILVEPIDLFQPNTEIRFSVESQYIHSHDYDILFARRVVGNLSPEYIPAFDAVMRNCRLIPYNMIIAKRKFFDEYSQWLFGVLFAVEDAVHLPSRIDYQKRVLAFLAERLLTVWVVHNRNRLRIKYRPHVFFESA